MKPARNKLSVRSNNTKTFPKSRLKRENDDSETDRHDVPVPLEFTPETKFTFKRRFYSTSMQNFTFSIYNLLAMKLVATTTIIGNSLFSVCRLKRLQIWTPCVTQGTAVSVTVTPLSFDSTDNNLNDLVVPISAITSMINRYAYVDFIPKKTHPSGMWHTSRAIDDLLFSINASAGSIFDFTLEVIENTSGGPLGYTRVLVGAVAGTIYTCSPNSGMTAVGTQPIA
jgi:hypothetical protein